MTSTFTPDILFEDNHLFIVNKPAGIPTQPDQTGQTNLLDLCKDWIGKTYNKPGKVFLETIHRLDKPVSGIIVFAKTSKALSRLNESMRGYQIKKTYTARLTGRLPKQQGRLVHYLVHGDFSAIVSSSNDSRAKEARLTYKVLSFHDSYSVVEIELETGRYHQIRAQFAAIGCPVQGDARYGAKPIQTGVGIALHHTHLKIPHPVSKEILSLTSPPPFL